MAQKGRPAVNATTTPSRLEQDTPAQAELAVATRGWAVLSRAGFTDGEDVDHDAVIRIARCFGVPSARDGGTEIWPVAPRITDPLSTFSMRGGEARLHTDAAYRADPENRFALFCVRPAGDGGLSRLLDARAAMADVPGATLELLRRPVWRWTPPSTFGGEPDVARAVATRDGRIRWRVDNLDVDARLNAVAAEFDRYLDGHPLVAQLPLATDSVLVCDNERVLHGRTWFADRRRLLLRVRLVTR